MSSRPQVGHPDVEHHCIIYDYMFCFTVWLLHNLSWGSTANLTWNVCRRSEIPGFLLEHSRSHAGLFHCRHAGRAHTNGPNTSFCWHIQIVSRLIFESLDSKNGPLCWCGPCDQSYGKSLSADHELWLLCQTIMCRVKNRNTTVTHMPTWMKSPNSAMDELLTGSHVNSSIFTSREQTPLTDEDHVIWLKTPEKLWPLRWELFRLFFYDLDWNWTIIYI